MTIATKQSLQSAIEYPDDDGEHMSDNTLQFKWIVVIKEGLEALYRHNSQVFVAGNLLWYPVQGDPDIRSAPDTLVAFNRPKGRRGSYKQWDEDSVAPQVVFEILSPGNRPDEMAREFEFYEKYNVLEYYMYDPDTGNLSGWLRSGRHLTEVPDMMGFVSPRMGVRFEPYLGTDNLTIVGPDGEPFLTYSEIIEQRRADREHLKLERQLTEAERHRASEERQLKEAERRRADEERQLKEAERRRADEERQLREAECRRADEERQRADRYALKLRELGIEPD
jgi:Uma2 family endonuclease